MVLDIAISFLSCKIFNGLLFFVFISNIKSICFIHEFIRHIIILEDGHYKLLGVECCGR